MLAPSFLPCDYSPLI